MEAPARRKLDAHTQWGDAQQISMHAAAQCTKMREGQPENLPAVNQLCPGSFLWVHKHGVMWTMLVVDVLHGMVQLNGKSQRDARTMADSDALSAAGLSMGTSTMKLETIVALYVYPTEDATVEVHELRMPIGDVFRAGCRSVVLAHGIATALLEHLELCGGMSVAGEMRTLLDAVAEVAPRAFCTALVAQKRAFNTTCPNRALYKAFFQTWNLPGCDCASCVRFRLEERGSPPLKKAATSVSPERAQSPEALPEALPETLPETLPEALASLAVTPAPTPVEPLLLASTTLRDAIAAEASRPRQSEKPRNVVNDLCAPFKWLVTKFRPPGASIKDLADHLTADRNFVLRIDGVGQVPGRVPAGTPHPTDAPRVYYRYEDTTHRKPLPEIARRHPQALQMDVFSECKDAARVGDFYHTYLYPVTKRAVFDNWHTCVAAGLTTLCIARNNHIQAAVTFRILQTIEGTTVYFVELLASAVEGVGFASLLLDMMTNCKPSGCDGRPLVLVQAVKRSNFWRHKVGTDHNPLAAKLLFQLALHDEYLHIDSPTDVDYAYYWPTL